MSFKRIQTASIIALVAVLVLSFYVSSPDTLEKTVVRSFPQAKLVQEEKLFVLDSINPVPVRLNYTFESNTTISLFIQTKSQFENSGKSSEPEEYLATFTGEEGSISYEPEDRSKRLVVSGFGEERYLVREIILESEYQSVVKGTRTLPILLLQLLVFVALGVQGYSLTQLSKED